MEALAVQLLGLFVPHCCLQAVTKAREQYFSRRCSGALLCGVQGGEWRQLKLWLQGDRGPAAAQCQQPLPAAAASAQGFITGDVCKLKLVVAW